MSKSLIGLVLPSIVVFGGATLGAWNKAEAPVREPAKPLGDLRPAAPDSSVARQDATPRELLDGVLAAIERADRAWLARSLASCAHAESLTDAELSVAWLRFEWAPARAAWDRIAAARAEHGGEFEVDGTRAVAVLGDGLVLPFVRLEGVGWRIADS